MSKDECRQRFKGNTPSQTEVKVISCIPIDVTDLQQKIFQLEKQLEQQLATENVDTKSQKGPSIVQTAIGHTKNTPCTKNIDAEVSCKSIGCRQSSTSQHNQSCLANNRSNVSFSYPTGPNQTQDCFYSTDVSEMTYTAKKRKPTDCRRMFFHKRKVPKKDKMKTQLVYYAQTEENSPFNNYCLADDETSKKRSNEESNHFKRSYFTSMVREQYKHTAVHECANMSEFSTPICRDVTHTPKTAELPYESDMCSCCHGQFQNLDNHMTKHNHLDIFSSQTDSKSAYYDANLYDVVPVRENAVKVKNFDFPKRKEPRNQMDIACWPGNIRPRYKVSPMILNYNTTAQTRQHIRKVPVKPHSRKEKELNKMSKKPTLYVPVTRKIITKHSNTRSVEFGDVYPKRLERNRRKVSKSTTPKVRNRNDAACLTTIITNTECQTTSATISNPQENKNEVVNVTLTENKTKETLNQIRDILQSVLTQVKTNSKICNTPDQTKKKDAVVQNGLSQSNIYGGSSLMQSFTYSPYNIDPYSPSCSQPRHPSSLCYPNIENTSVKCMQHYPLFIQPGRNTCTSCYGNNPQVYKSPTMRRAASTATNTEDLCARTKETESLIKEIYKAMALNIEIPTEDNLVNEHGDINQNYNTRAEDSETKHIAKAISEIFKNTNPLLSSVTQNTGTPIESKLASNETSFGSQLTQNYAQSVSKETTYVYNDDTHSETADNDETEQASRELESDEESDVTIVNEVTESSSSETESEEDDVPVAVEDPYKAKEKKGLFSKMLKIFMPRSRSRKKSRKEDQPSEDSIEYRTVQSHRGAPAKPAPNVRSKSRAVVFYSKKPRAQSPASLPQRTPYMEQEYRRYFDEKLTFHDSQRQMASIRESAPRGRSVYFQKVEARSALVDHFNQRNEFRQTSPRSETTSTKQYRNQNQESDARVKAPFPEKASIVPPTAITWLEKHKLGMHCGKQWKKLILEG